MRVKFPATHRHHLKRTRTMNPNTTIPATSTDATIEATIRAQFPDAPAEVDTAVDHLIDRVQSAAYQVNASKRGDVDITDEHLDITVTITA